jgi:hypothetical protein
MCVFEAGPPQSLEPNSCIVFVFPGTHCPRVNMGGEHPHNDLNITSKCTGTFAGYKADNKARRESHNFNRHAQATFICDECFATQTFPCAPVELNYADFGEFAPWTRTTESFSSYLMSATLLSPFTNVRGWTSKVELGMCSSSTQLNGHTVLCARVCRDLWVWAPGRGLHGLRGVVCWGQSCGYYFTSQ